MLLATALTSHRAPAAAAAAAPAPAATPAAAPAAPVVAVVPREEAATQAIGSRPRQKKKGSTDKNGPSEGQSPFPSLPFFDGQKIAAPLCGSIMRAHFRSAGRWHVDAIPSSGAHRTARSRPDTSANLRAHVGAHAQAITGSFPAPCVRAHREADARPDATADAVHVLFSEPLVRPYRVCYHPREGRLRHRRLVRRTYRGGQLRCRR